MKHGTKAFLYYHVLAHADIFAPCLLVLTIAIFTSASGGDRGRMHTFEAFYSSKYQGRRLAWAHALEHCLVSNFVL